MYLSLNGKTHKAYLQWFPFSKLSESDKRNIASKNFYEEYIKTGSVVFFPDVMRHSENYIQKSDGSFRNSFLVSPILFLFIQAVGKEISKCYESQRPSDIKVYYAGNYCAKRPKYKQDYDAFYKLVNAKIGQYNYFIKTDITRFFDNINVNELIKRIDRVCNKQVQTISQTRLLLIKELILFCGNGCFPLIENSIASSYLSTIVYLDDIDCNLYAFLTTKIKDISHFQMIRYVDDLYILIESEKSLNQLISTYNAIINTYSSFLKKYGLSLNTKKCIFKKTCELNEILKKSQYDEYVNGIKFELGQLYEGSLSRFLKEVLEKVSITSLTNEQYTGLIEKIFTFNDIEFTPEEVFNYLVYENQAELKRPDVSRLLVQIIERDISFLSIDPKRLSVMVVQSGNDNAIKAMLNQLFIRWRAGLWNSYDTTVAIAYLIQSKFQHIDLLNILKEECPDLYSYYYHACRCSFLCQIRDEKWNKYRVIIKNDIKATFLYFMSLCEENRSNYLGAYAYYKSFFDRMSADVAFSAGKDHDCRKPNYKRYYKQQEHIKLYAEIEGSVDIIKTAHNLRNANPLSHASAELIDKDSSSIELREIQEKLDSLVYQFIRDNNL